MFKNNNMSVKWHKRKYFLKSASRAENGKWYVNVKREAQSLIEHSQSSLTIANAPSNLYYYTKYPFSSLI